MELIALQNAITEPDTSPIINILNFAIGYVSKDILKDACEIFKEVTRKTLEKQLEGEALQFQYGPPTGSAEWKEQTALFLSQAYGHPVLRDNLVLSCGSHHAMQLVLTTLLDLNGVLFVDELTFGLGIFQQFTSIEIVPVAFDMDSGPDVDDLRRKVAEKRFAPCKGKLFWGVYYTMTVFHNPTGVTYSAEVCRKLVELAREENFLIASDDTSNLLSYSTKVPPKRLFAYDNPANEDYQGNVVSLGSFSKIFSPGTRIGWLECPQRVSKFFAKSTLLNCTGATNHFTSFLVATLIRDGLLHQHFEQILLKYKERHNFVYNYLRKNLPEEVDVKSPGGGCFLWLRFPPDFSVTAFGSVLAQEHELHIFSGSFFAVNPEKFSNFCRIVFIFHDLPTLAVASEKFCATFRAFSGIK
ncbi:uncharacterized protein LOC132255970 [Phlebotomus argentipes]|uniref:uncharacterized protein LOC132255970 n=1 Tax=Phlebotomus argentipes TaxID=94469 RepID=UPI0028929AD7|nr:uncharacterized protein LOC132255970 [Phlebotomus argentipes]